MGGRADPGGPGARLTAALVGRYASQAGGDRNDIFAARSLAALDRVDDEFDLSILGRFPRTGRPTQLCQVDHGSTWKLGTLRYQVPLVTDYLRAALLVPSDSQKPCLLGSDASCRVPAPASFLSMATGVRKTRYDSPCIERCCARVHRACGFGRNHCHRLWRGSRTTGAEVLSTSLGVPMDAARAATETATGTRLANSMKIGSGARPAPNYQSESAARSSEVFQRRHRRKSQYPPRKDQTAPSAR